MTHAIERQSNGTIVLTITIPWKLVSAAYEEVVSDAVKEAELPGFRKGKAPKAAVEKTLDKTKLYEEVVKRIIPKSYSHAVEEEKLRPIIYPKIELVEATENKDWVLRALTCERPKLTLGDYKKAVKDVKDAKRNKIWLPGQEPKADEKEEKQKPTLSELLNAVYEAIDVTLPDLLIEHEVNRLLSELLDQTKKLGLTVEQYLSSTSRNADSIRLEYTKQAKRTLTLEFSLEDIADKEGILVGEDDIDAVVKSAKSEEERASLSKERYYLASVLRRQKTIDYLAQM